MKLKKTTLSIIKALAKEPSDKLFFIKSVKRVSQKKFVKLTELMRSGGISFIPSAALGVLLSTSISATAAPPSPDFNNDNYSDLVVGVPGDRDFGRVGSALAYQNGAVNIIRGSTTGLISRNNQVWGQDSPNILGVGAEVTDDFGAAVAAGDFNGDGRTDLAIGSPNDKGDGGGPAGDNLHIAEGVVNIVYGSGTGLNSTGNQLLNQKTAGTLRAGSYQDGGDGFGASLAAGDFNNDGFDDLAVGIPNEDLNANYTQDHGLVYIIYGSMSGLRTTTAQTWSQDSSGIADVAESQDHFAAALATGDFDNDGYDDLAIGVPDEDLGSYLNSGAGAVHILYGSKNRLSSSRSQFWTQNSTNVLDTAEINDQFGAALAVGDFNNDGRDDLAIGVPGENPTTLNALNDAGAVNILYGATGGLNTAGNQFWSQNTANVADQSEKSDRFGNELVTGDFNGDGSDDLAIGVPREDLAASTHYLGYGAVHVLFGGFGTNRLSATGSQFWTQDSAGIADKAEDGDSFGKALGKGDYDGDGFDDLVIGVPGEDSPSCGSVQPSDVGMVHVLYGATSGPTAVGSQVWCQNSSGILSDGLANEAFGSALIH